MRSNGKTTMKPELPLGTRIRKTFYGLVATLILVGLLSGLLHPLQRTDTPCVEVSDKSAGA